MSALRAVLLASLVAAWLAVPLLAVPTTATDGELVRPMARTLAEEANNTSQATIGEQISGFMQEQTSQANGAVESGMWSAAYENADDESRKAALVNERTSGLSDEVASLQAERQELLAARDAGEISQLEFRSRMNRLAGQYASLLAAIDETQPRAQEVGANVTAIENLRNAATEAAGPSVSATAGSAAVSPPGLGNNTTAGPPADVPGQGNATDDGNGNGVGNGNGSGNGNGNGVGNGNGNGNGNGIGNGIGNDDTFDFSNPLRSSDVTLADPFTAMAG
jgi:hypothetical protein